MKFIALIILVLTGCATSRKPSTTIDYMSTSPQSIEQSAHVEVQVNHQWLSNAVLFSH